MNPKHKEQENSISEQIQKITIYVHQFMPLLMATN